MHYLSTMKVPSHLCTYTNPEFITFTTNCVKACSGFGWEVGGIGFWFLMLFCLSHEPSHNLELWTLKLQMTRHYNRETTLKFCNRTWLSREMKALPFPDQALSTALDEDKQKQHMSRYQRHRAQMAHPCRL